MFVNPVTFRTRWSSRRAGFRPAVALVGPVFCCALLMGAGSLWAGEDEKWPPWMGDAIKDAMKGKGISKPDDAHGVAQVPPLPDRCEGGIPPSCPEGCMPDEAHTKCLPASPWPLGPKQ